MSTFVLKIGLCVVNWYIASHAFKNQGTDSPVALGYVQGHQNERSWVRTPSGTSGASKTATVMAHFSGRAHPLWPMTLSRCGLIDKQQHEHKILLYIFHAYKSVLMKGCLFSDWNWHRTYRQGMHFRVEFFREIHDCLLMPVYLSIAASKILLI